MRKNLKLLRVKYDLTQGQMAALLGITRATYCNIENGKSKGTMKFWLAVKKEFPETTIDEAEQIEKR